MAQSFINLEDEALPSFLSSSLDSTGDHATLGNVTFGSGPGLPVAASTVYKIKAWADNRGPAVDASYLEAGQLSSANLQSSKGEQAKFSLSFKDDLDNVDDFIAAHRFSDMLVKIRMDESPSRAQASKLGPPPKPGMLHGQPTELETDLSTGLLTFTQCGNRDIMERKPFGATTDEDCPGSDKQDSVPFSGSISSFLANEKLMSVDSINNDLTDDDLDMSNIPDDELEMYFKKLVPPSIQRGRVEGQEIPAAVLPGAPDKTPNTSTMDDCDQEDFRMLDVRLAATGMDSCPASDEEDTEDELEAVRTNGTSTRSRQLLPSTSRQLVGESNRPSFRPGLEGGSSDDEPFTGRGGPSVSGIEQRCSAEGQVINPPVTGNGGDGSSGSEESGNDGGVSTIPLTSTGVQAAYNMLRGLGMVGASGVGEDSSSDLSHLPVFGKNVFSTHSGMGDRVGPVGTGEASSSPGALVGLQRQSPVNWSMTLDRQEALTLLPDCCGADEDDGMDEADGATPSLSLWGGPSGDATNSTSEEDNQLLSTSLEAKYFSQTFHQAQEDSDDGWSRGPDGLNFPQDSVVYLNEEGKWVTDLAYYTSFEKVADGNMPENVVQFQSEDFLPAGNSIEKIINDQLEFEKEHQFMQEEQIEATSGPSLGEASWKPPVSGHILMRASQVSSEFEQGNRSYLRLSLGEFFQQRSEALGSLGNGHDTEAIKRPSFGYVITSPEKREPFALIRPSDFSSQDNSLLNITVELNEADQTLNTEDLDRTLEAPGSRLSPKGDTDPEPHEKEDPSIAAGLPFNSGTPGAVSDITNQSLISLNNTSTDLMLSISTIASAIADASISTDPSQLAVMIIELSKRRKAKSHLANARPAETASGAPEEPTPVEYTKPAQVDQSALHDTLQFDMEKYLRQADVSGSSPNSDSSIAHSTFNLTGWNSLDGHPAEVHGDSSQPQGNYVRQKSDLQNGDGNGRGEAVTFSSNSTRSSIPRPKASCIPKPLSSSARRSTGFGPSYTLKPSADGKAAATTAECHSPPANKGKPKAEASPSGASNAHRVALGTVRLQVSNIKASSASQKGQNSCAVSPGSQKTSPGLRKVRSGLPCLKASSPPCQKLRKLGQLQPEQGSDIQEKSTEPRSSVVSPSPHAGFACQSPEHTANLMFDSHSSSEPSVVETGESPCNFRPSTSPLIHSSPSQTSFPSADSTTSPPSSNGAVADRSPGCELSPQSTCSSPSLSRLTYISINDRTVIPTPERKKNDFTMALSTTIIRASPTLPIEPDQELNCPSKSLDQLQSQQSKSLDPLPPHQGKSQSSSALGCTRSKSECSYHWGEGSNAGAPAGCGHNNHYSDSGARQLAKVDSGYSSNLNIQQQGGTAVTHNYQQWGAVGSISTQAYHGGGLDMPASYSSEELRYMPVSSVKPQGGGLVNPPHNAGIQSLLAGRPPFNHQLAPQYLGPEAPLNPVPYMRVAANGLYGVAPSGMPLLGDPTTRQLHSIAGPLGVSGTTDYHQVLRPHQNRLELGIMGTGKPFSQHTVEPWVAGGLDDLQGQVTVPNELRFPHGCCVGIASQASLSLFNPSERWQQVSIVVTSLAIDGEKVESLPYQWLIMKNKTIIGPKSTEEQKVLFIPPQAGVYQCVLSVSSWPTSAESEVAARAEVFAKRVLLVAIAQSPAVEVDAGKSSCLDFGDLSGGSAKSLPLKLLNRTNATVPIRLVISANATAWRCFTFSKNPVATTAEGSLHVGHMTQLSSPSVMNHVMHATCGENPENFIVWVHFRAPQMYATSGELGPADEYIARIDIEVDSPGPCHVIQSITLRGRAGTARVHAPRDLQTVSLSTPLGKSTRQNLPLKNAGNIDVQLKLKSSDADNCFSVQPDQLYLRAGEEQAIEVSFSAQGGMKSREGLLTILVLPSGPQYEVSLKGEVIPEATAHSGSILAPEVAANVPPPILSNKQFVAWGGVTLGRAVQQKLVLRNNSPNATQQLRLLIRGQDQDCFQLQSLFSPEERLTRHGELSIRTREDVAVHLLFAPTRVACMLAKLEIKQSGVQPSQPGVKFTIPLSGYGGTSNIIVEDQRKRADGYVATMMGVAVGHVSKVCLCVRNTGSRAAFVKAVTFSDIQNRSVMDPLVISVSPSQFVLKERTQEV